MNTIELKAISSLAMIKTIWDKQRKDYIDLFVPFIATLIKKNKYSEIVTQTIIDDFKSEYGLYIPQQPMWTILSRCIRREIIKKENHKYFPNIRKVDQVAFSSDEISQRLKQNNLINKFIDYCKNDQRVVIGLDEASRMIINFLKNSDSDILFVSQNESTLPKVKSGKKDRYLVSKFLLWCKDNDYNTFQYFIDMAFGNIMANLLFYDFGNYEGKYSNVEFVLDTTLLLNLTGLHGNEKFERSKNFIEILKVSKARISYFQHTFDEALGILIGARNSINQGNYDPRYASPVLRYCVENNKTESDIDFIIAKFEEILKKFNLKKIPVPDFFKNREFQEDYEKIREYIKREYPDSAKEISIDKDVKSISAIYRFRKGNFPMRLVDCNYTFITTNSALARAASKYQDFVLRHPKTIPSCLTDTFVGTVIWLQNPIDNNVPVELDLIAKCYAALKPDGSLLNKFVEHLDDLKERGKISEGDYRALIATTVSQNILMDITKGDSDEFDEKTSFEIIEREKEKGRREAEVEFKSIILSKETQIEKLKSEKEKTSEELSQTKNKLQEYEIAKKKQKEHISKKSETIANMVSWGVFIIFTIVAIILYKFCPKGWSIISFCIAILSLSGIIFGKRIVFKRWLIHQIEKWLTNETD